MAADIPDRSANAAHVRRFITDVLVSDYYTDPNFASETARAWRIGRGSEFHDAKQKYFQDLFGVEIGFCLYRSVFEARDKQWQNSRTGLLINCKSSAYNPYLLTDYYLRWSAHLTQGVSFCRLFCPFGLYIRIGPPLQILVSELLLLRSLDVALPTAYSWGSLVHSFNTRRASDRSCLPAT